MADGYDLAEEKFPRARPTDHRVSATHDHPAHELQRSAGNSAVAAALQSGEHERSPVLGVVGRGGGSALPPALQRDMSVRFGGADFSGVRLHHDSAAQASAAAVGARAYTTGHEVVLGDGVDLASPDGQKTLAHELTHVVQQRSGPVAGNDTGAGVSVSDPADRLEQEAEANAERVMADAAPAVSSDTAAASVQREELPGVPEEEEDPVAVSREVLHDNDDEQLT